MAISVENCSIKFSFWYWVSLTQVGWILGFFQGFALFSVLLFHCLSEEDTNENLWFHAYCKLRCQRFNCFVVFLLILILQPFCCFYQLKASFELNSWLNYVKSLRMSTYDWTESKLSVSTFPRTESEAEGVLNWFRSLLVSLWFQLCSLRMMACLNRIKGMMLSTYLLMKF